MDLRGEGRAMAVASERARKVHLSCGVALSALTLDETHSMRRSLITSKFKVLIIGGYKIGKRNYRGRENRWRGNLPHRSEAADERSAGSFRLCIFGRDVAFWHFSDPCLRYIVIIATAITDLVYINQIEHAICESELINIQPYRSCLMIRAAIIAESRESDLKASYFREERALGREFASISD
jgi:hypothetical protein